MFYMVKERRGIMAEQKQAVAKCSNCKKRLTIHVDRYFYYALFNGTGMQVNKEAHLCTVECLEKWEQSGPIDEREWLG